MARIGDSAFRGFIISLLAAAPIWAIIGVLVWLVATR